MERIGFMNGEISVPDDFDTIDVVSLFEDDSEKNLNDFILLSCVA